jgi:hypothetical protein
VYGNSVQKVSGACRCSAPRHGAKPDRIRVNLLAAFDETRRISLLDIVGMKLDLSDMLGCKIDCNKT